MVDQYCQAVLFPDTCNVTGIPDCFPRRTAVWRLTTQMTLSSSVANGHVLMVMFPQGAVTTGNFYISYGDGGSALDVTNFQSATVTATTVAGTSISANYNYARIVGCQFKFIYIGAEQTAAGEATVSILNQNIASGNNVAAMARDSDFKATGRAESEFVINWIPLDYSDLEFRTVNDNADADKGSYWGTLCMVGSGFPKGVPVYAVEIAVIVEGIVIPTSGDFIPRSISQPVSPDMALLRLKQLIMQNPAYVARAKHMCLNAGFSRTGTPGDGQQGGPASTSSNPFSYVIGGGGKIRPMEEKSYEMQIERNDPIKPVEWTFPSGFLGGLDNLIPPWTINPMPVSPNVPWHGGNLPHMGYKIPRSNFIKDP